MTDPVTFPDIIKKEMPELEPILSSINWVEVKTFGKKFIFDQTDEKLQAALILLYHTLNPPKIELPRSLSTLILLYEKDNDSLCEMSIEELEIMSDYNPELKELAYELIKAAIHMQEVYVDWVHDKSKQNFFDVVLQNKN
jgi:hypothetical protein